jgi:hypothetical protein
MTFLAMANPSRRTNNHQTYLTSQMELINYSIYLGLSKSLSLAERTGACVAKIHNGDVKMRRENLADWLLQLV